MYSATEVGSYLGGDVLFSFVRVYTHTKRMTKNQLFNHLALYTLFVILLYNFRKSKEKKKPKIGDDQG